MLSHRCDQRQPSLSFCASRHPTWPPTTKRTHCGRTCSSPSSLYGCDSINWMFLICSHGTESWAVTLIFAVGLHSALPPLHPVAIPTALSGEKPWRKNHKERSVLQVDLPRLLSLGSARENWQVFTFRTFTGSHQNQSLKWKRTWRRVWTRMRTFRWRGPGWRTLWALSPTRRWAEEESFPLWAVWLVKVIDWSSPLYRNLWWSWAMWASSTLAKWSVSLSSRPGEQKWRTSRFAFAEVPHLLSSMIRRSSELAVFLLVVLKC